VVAIDPDRYASPAGTLMATALKATMFPAFCQP